MVEELGDEEHLVMTSWRREIPEPVFTSRGTEPRSNRFNYANDLFLALERQQEPQLFQDTDTEECQNSGPAFAEPNPAVPRSTKGRSNL
jgi:hypothetical protein